MSQQDVEALVLERAAAQQSAAPSTTGELATWLGRPVSAEELADIRHLIGLYYAERAADLVDAQWVEEGWTAETMHEWLREHLRTSHGRPTT